MKNKLIISPKTALKIKKAYMIFATVLALCTLCAIQAFADVDTSALKNAVEQGLIIILSLTGGGIAVFGVIHLVQAQSSHDPNQKTQGIQQLATGLGLIAVANLLIPVFINMIDF